MEGHTVQGVIVKQDQIRRIIRLGIALLEKAGHRLRRSCRVLGATRRGPPTGRHPIVEPYRWERHFRTRSVSRINERTRPGAQEAVWQILKSLPFSRLSAAERREWMKIASYSQLVALGLQVSFIQYDLIVLQKE